MDGGFATHVRVPARYLVPVPGLPPGHAITHLAVIAHAVTAPYQALLRARVAPGDPVVVIGIGGIGIYAVQLAAAHGARVVAVDKIESRSRRAEQYGAVAGVCTAGLPEEVARDAILEAAAAEGLAPDGWKIFEMSGTPTGQALAFALLGPAGTLGLVGRQTGGPGCGRLRELGMPSPALLRGSGPAPRGTGPDPAVRLLPSAGSGQRHSRPSP